MYQRGEFVGNPKVQKEILDAIDIIVKKRLENTPQILFGIVTDILDNNKCNVTINTIGHQLRYYGDTLPTLNKKYPVFIPASGMSNAFVITSGTGSSGDTSMEIDGHTLVQSSEGVVRVNTATEAEEDNTLPITSAAVYTNIGNIEVLLETI